MTEGPPHMTHPKPRSALSLLGRLHGAFGRNPGRRALRPPAELDRLSRHIILPSMSVTDEELARATFQDKGMKLARQEMWEELSDMMREADEARSGTPGGESAAILMAFGARSDVVAMVEDSLSEGRAPARHGIDALDVVAEELRGDYPVEAVVAMAHIDMAWAWRAMPEATALEGAGAQAGYHSARAEGLLRLHGSAELTSPLLAAAHCALLRIQPTCTDAALRNVADQYRRLIDLDPGSPRHMRALGAAILAAQPGGYQQLELAARRTAARTGATWGAGAYAWVYLDALAQLDPAFFIDGLRDILRLCPDQHTANLMAAFCAITMRSAGAGLAAGARTRAALHDCLTWILRDHLHELHPLIWTQALHCPGAGPLPPRRALISEGRRTALRVIAAQYADDIARGHSIAFSPSGMYMLPSL